MTGSQSEGEGEFGHFLLDRRTKLAIASAALAAGVDFDVFSKIAVPRGAVAAASLAALLAAVYRLRGAPESRRSWVLRIALILAVALLIPMAFVPGPWVSMALAITLLATSAALVPAERGRLPSFLWEILPIAVGSNFSAGGIVLLAHGRIPFGLSFACFGLGFIGMGTALMRSKLGSLLASFALLGLSFAALGLLVVLAGDRALGVVVTVVGVAAVGVSVIGIRALSRARRANAGSAAETLATGTANGRPAEVIPPYVAADEVVVLVHGTFSADKSGSDKGERWWQRGSTTWTWFEEHLPDGVALVDDQIGLFHWSGSNSQADRYAASTKLLAYLIHLERAGKRYHLIGHSHGGSLIWEALISSVELRRRPPRQVPKELLYAVAERDPETRPGHGRRARRAAQREVYGRLDLAGLRTWTTVGTPFLHHLPRKRRFIRGWPQSTFSLFGGARELIGRTLLVLVVAIVGFILTEAAIGVVKDFISGHASLSEIVTFSLFAIFALAYRRRVNIRNFAEGLIQRERSSCYAFLVFADRWLGMWAPSDEAIAALKASAPHMACDYTWLCSSPRTRPPQPVPHYLRDILTGRDAQLRLPQPRGAIQLIPDATLPSVRRFLSPFYYAYDRWLSARAGRMVSRVLLHSAQGCDLPGAFLAYVAPWPVPIRKPMGGLPLHISRALEVEANAGAEKVGPELRRLLANIAIDGSRTLGSAIPGKALLHTSYFDHPDVLRLITLHISHSQHTGSTLDCGHDRPDLCAWLLRTKKKSATRYRNFVNEVEHSWQGQHESIIRRHGLVIEYYSSRFTPARSTPSRRGG